VCEKVHKKSNTIPDCEVCNKPMILPENFEALRVYSLCSKQLILSYGGIVGIRLEAIIASIDLLDIPRIDRVEIVEKILLISDVLYKKEEGN